jgi:hypothetical protein
VFTRAVAVAAAVHHRGHYGFVILVEATEVWIELAARSQLGGGLDDRVGVDDDVLFTKSGADPTGGWDAVGR